MLVSFKKKSQKLKKLSEVRQRAKTACRAAAMCTAVIAAAGAPWPCFKVCTGIARHVCGVTLNSKIPGTFK